LVLAVFLNSCADDDEIIRDGIILNEGSDNEIQTNTKIGTISLSEIGRTSARVSVAFTEIDPSFPITQHGYVWSTTNSLPTLSDEFNELGDLSETGEVSALIDGLQTGTSYFIRAYFTAAQGTGFGSVTTFETLPDLVLSVNEGNFLAANGSLSSFSVTTGTVNQTLYDAGATVQNAISFDDDLYLVTNAPDKVDILSIDGNDVSFTTSISSGFLNPVSFARVGNFGYVTNWGDISTAFGENPDSFLSIIDLTTNQVIDSLDLEARPQEIIAVGNMLYLANEGVSTITVVEADGANSTVVMDITVPSGPSTFVEDAEGDLWVLCSSGNLVEINLESNAVTTTIDGLTVAGFDEKMAINNSGTTLYFLGGGNDTFTGQTNVFEVDLTVGMPTATAFVTGGFAFYGIGVDPENGDVYVGDSNAFQSTGTGFRYNSSGTQIQQFATGIGPNSFVFL
jgi:hypothetical protein